MRRIAPPLAFLVGLVTAASAPAAEQPEKFFVIVDDAPIRDADTGKPLGTLERGTWLERKPGRTSFVCYDPWNKAVTLEPDHFLPAGKAMDFFIARIAVHPNADDYADRAAVFLRHGAYYAALDDFARALEMDPNHYRALRRRAECREIQAVVASDFAERKRLVEAGLKDADRCLTLRPDDFMARDAHYLLCALVDVDKALADLEKAVKLRPTHAPLYNNRAKYHLDLGRRDECLSDLNRAIELAPDYSDAYTNRGIISHYRRDFARAIDDATSAIRFNPLNRSAWNNRGNAYLETKQYAKAIDDFTEMIRLKPQDSDGYFGRALIYFALGSEADEQDYLAKGRPVPTGERRSSPSFRKALDDCEAGLERNPRDYKTFNTKGNVLKKLDKPHEAIEVFDSAIRKIEKETSNAGITVLDSQGKPHDLGHVVGQVLSFAESGRFDAEAHRMALTHPHHVTIAALAENRADAYRMQLQDPKHPDPSAAPKMLNDLTRAILFDPQNADYFRVRGYYNLEFKRWEQAVSDLTRALKLRPNYPDAFRGRIIANMEQGDRVMTIGTLNSGLKAHFFDQAWADARALEKLGSPLDTPTLDRLKQLSGREK